MNTKILASAILVILGAGESASAREVCKSYRKKGNVQVEQLCFKQAADGRITNLRMIDDSGVAWLISSGSLEWSRANRICGILDLGSAKEETDFQVGSCSSNQTLLNLSGHYSMNQLFGDTSYYTSIRCSR